MGPTIEGVFFYSSITIVSTYFCLPVAFLVSGTIFGKANEADQRATQPLEITATATAEEGSVIEQTFFMTVVTGNHVLSCLQIRNDAFSNKKRTQNTLRYCFCVVTTGASKSKPTGEPLAPATAVEVCDVKNCISLLIA